jgi:hypothetical protein
LFITFDKEIFIMSLLSRITGSLFKSFEVLGENQNNSLSNHQQYVNDKSSLELFDPHLAELSLQHVVRHVVAGSNTSALSSAGNLSTSGTIPDSNVTSNATSSSRNATAYKNSADVLNTALESIFDIPLRSEVKAKLLTVLNKRGSGSVQAAVDLSVMARPGNENSERVYQVIETVSKKYSTNANLKLALARAKVDRLKAVIGPLSPNHPQMIIYQKRVTEIKNLAWDAIKLVAGRDIMTGEKTAGYTINREEAALLNKYAAQVFESVGDSYQANERREMARFYESTHNERLHAMQGEELDINKKEGEKRLSMRGATPHERALKQRLAENQRARDKVIKDWGEAHRDDNIYDTKQAIPEAEVTQSYGTTNNVWDKAGPRDRQRFVEKTYVANPKGSSGTGNAIRKEDAVAEVFKLFRAYKRMNAMTPLINDKLKLEKALKEELTVITPPRPEHLQKMRDEIMRLASEANDPRAIRYAKEVMQHIEERSHAFWNE